MECTDKNTVKRAILSRPNDGHKGTFGTLLSICGSYSMAGAVMLSSKSALKCGLGLLKTALPQSIYPIVAQSVCESVFLPLKETDEGRISKSNIENLLKEAEKASAVLIGCGLGVCDDTKQLVKEFILNCTTPMVLDADALNCIADKPEILKSAKAEIIITPHPAEMARLINSTAKKVNEDRANTALSFAKEYNTITVLKGAGTIIASPDGRVLINNTGNSGMATGGSGDVLAGMIASLLAQNKNAFDCASAGVYLHGLSGDIAKEKLGEISMLPSDTIDCIHLAFKQCGF